LPLFSWQIVAVPIGQWAGWAPEPVHKGGKIIVPTSFRPLDRPARSDNGTYIKVLIYSKKFPILNEQFLHNYDFNFSTLNVAIWKDFSTQASEIG
jgi:hypothetical protein